MNVTRETNTVAHQEHTPPKEAGDLGVAVVILDMPMRYYCDPEIPVDWPSVGLRVMTRTASRTYLRARLEQIPASVCIVLVAAKRNIVSLQSMLDQHGYFGRRRDTVMFCATGSCFLMSPRTGDFAVDRQGHRILAPEGSFSALTQIFSSGLAGRLLNAGIGYLQLTFMENWGATLDYALLRMVHDGGKGVLAELTAWKDEDGPLAVTMEGKPVMLEREQISDDIYAMLRSRREFVGGSGTNTYWISLERLLATFGISNAEISTHSPADQLTLALQQRAESVFLPRTHQGREVVFADNRLSVLTQFMEAQFVEVPNSRYTPL